MHTTLGAHPFRVELPPGRHTIRVEHGKEFFPEVREIDVQPGLAPLTIALRRWSDVAAQGWYSGDTHNHRDPAELANVMLAEDVNVGLPMVDWTTVENVAPERERTRLRGRLRRPTGADRRHPRLASAQHRV